MIDSIKKKKEGLVDHFTYRVTIRLVSLSNGLTIIQFNKVNIQLLLFVVEVDGGIKL